MMEMKKSKFGEVSFLSGDKNISRFSAHASEAVGRHDHEEENITISDVILSEIKNISK